MLEATRSASPPAYLPIAPANQEQLEPVQVPGTEKPTASSGSQAVTAADQSAATNNKPKPERPEQSTAARADQTEQPGKAKAGPNESAPASEKTAGQTGVEQELKDPNSALSQMVRELSARDREVRAHEQAHVAAAGQYATSGPHYNYQTGPDGRRYAIGGEVGIDTAVVPDDPQATLVKMQVVQRAALAPAEPSAQDMRVAADASQKAARARMDIMRDHLEARAQPSEAHSQASGDSEAIDAREGERPSEPDSALGHQAKQAVSAYREQSASLERAERIDLAA